ncbi:ATP-binding cassette domain-containing protein [Acidithiobacillus ferriphilus]|nr:ATP-binding cassette domain-containing protein [Acidithiobacillus ferriphilus]
MSEQIILSVEHLRQSFAIGREHLEVIRDINLEVRHGERVAIVGASGQGKSTLMHLMGGLERPSGGGGADSWAGGLQTGRVGAQPLT